MGLFSRFCVRPGGALPAAADSDVRSSSVFDPMMRNLARADDLDALRERAEMVAARAAVLSPHGSQGSGRHLCRRIEKRPPAGGSPDGLSSGASLPPRKGGGLIGDG
jgi:hypothetical protein